MSRRPRKLGAIHLHLRYALKNIQIKLFMPDCSIVVLNIGVLLQLAGLDMVQGYSLGFGPFGER